MSRFFIGQRVRIKWSKYWPYLAGEQGTIARRVDNGDGDWVVAPDCWGDTHPLDDDEEFGPGEEQLEPATDGNMLVSWSDCAWRPEHLREGSRKPRRRSPRKTAEPA